MEDKVRVVILSICYVVAFIVGAGLLIALRIDVGKEAFYTGLLILIVILIVFAIQFVTAIGGRMAQRSDNVEIAMAGAYRALLESMATQQRAQVDQLRAYGQIVPPPSAPMPSLPWATNNDATDAEPSFEAEDVWVGGGNVARH